MVKFLLHLLQRLGGAYHGPLYCGRGYGDQEDYPDRVRCHGASYTRVLYSIVRYEGGRGVNRRYSYTMFVDVRDEVHDCISTQRIVVTHTAMFYRTLLRAYGDLGLTLEEIILYVDYSMLRKP